MRPIKFDWMCSKENQVALQLSLQLPFSSHFLSHLSLLVDVPGEGDGIVGDLLNVADGVEALLVVSWEAQDT